MPQLYLLLRNGKQSGPFTIGELLQQSPRASDMLWLEGKSTGWVYISELEFGLQSDAAKITKDKAVAEPSENTKLEELPQDDLEAKAEALRKRALSYKSKANLAMPAVQTSRTPERQQVADPEIKVNLYNKKRQKNHVATEAFLTLGVIGIVVLLIVKGRDLTSPVQPNEPAVATKINTSDAHLAKPSSNSDTSINTVGLIDQPLTVDTSLLMRAPRPIKRLSPKSVKALEISAKSDEVISTSDDSRLLPQVTEVPTEQNAKQETIKEQTGSTVEPEKEEKKKSFLKGLFKKKKKDKKEEDQKED